MTLKLKRMEKQLVEKDEALIKKEQERLDDQKETNKRMQEMTDAIRSGIRFITQEQDWSSQISKKISTSKVGQLVKRNARAAGLDYPSSGSASVTSTPMKR